MLSQQADDGFSDSHYHRIGGTGEPEEQTQKWVEYRKKWDEYPKSFTVNDFPLHLDIELTNKCNLKCPMCFRYFMNEDEGYMNFGLFKKIIDESERYDLPAINITWRGESFLHKQLIDMVRYAKGHSIIDLRANTNATLITEKMAVELIGAGIDRVIISMDGNEKETYEKIRVGAKYEKVVRNIERLVQKRDERGLKKPFVEIQAVDMKQTHDQLEGLVEKWGNVVNKVTRIIYRNPLGEEGSIFRVGERPVEQIPCDRLWQRLTVTWSGRIHACCGDNQGKLVIGDANTDNLYDAWHSERMKNLRRLHSELRGDLIAACKVCEFNKE